MNMVRDSTFGTWVKQQRRALDLTQEALAEKSGCSVEMVRKIEAGSARPSRQLAELICASLDVPQAEIPAFVQWARTGVRISPSPTEQQEPSPDESEPTRIAQEPLTKNPYKGLQPFREADAEDFFGREGLTNRLLERLAEQGELARFLAVVGPSGSGKSSVVRAGLLPALRTGSLPGSDHWTVIDMIPGAHPFEELEAALLRVAVNPPATLLDQLERDERGILQAAKRVLPGGEDLSLVLIIDQFEELFTLVPKEDERRFFLSSLYAAVSDPRSPVRIITTLRADFYDRPLVYPDSGDLMRRRTEVVLPMTSDELERAIVLPAQRVGVDLEYQLLAAIIQDVSEKPGALPLLQYALTELFERREGRLLTLKAYHESGGVPGALSRRADAIYASLNRVEQEEARQLFLRLVALGEGDEDTRRRVRRREVVTAAHDEAAVERVMELFGRYRLLTFDRDPVTASPTVEVAHEALLRTWKPLREWLDASRESLRVQRRLTNATAEWLSSEQDPSFLAPAGVRLSQFEALAAEGDLALNKEEQAYLEASIAERERLEQEERERQERELQLARQSEKAQRSAAVRLRYLVGGLFLFLLVAFGLSVFAFSRQAEANAQRHQAESSLARSEALRLAAEANTILEGSRPPELAALLDIHSLNTQYTVQGDMVLGQLGILDMPLRHFGPLPASMMAVAFAPDGKTFLTAGWGNKQAILWDTDTGEQLKVFSGHEAPLWSVAFSPDGKWALTGSDDGTARLWDVSTGSELHQFKGHSDVILAVAFSPNGAQVLTSSYDGTARLWDATTGSFLRAFTGHTGPVNAVTFSPDGSLVLTGSADMTAKIWESSTGKVLQTLSGHTSWVFGVAFSPDGKLAVTGGDRTARLWDTRSGKEVAVFTGHTDEVHPVAFSPDGKQVLTGSADRTARLWDVKSGQELRQFIGHNDGVTGVTFSPDSKSALTTSLDGTALLWDLNLHPEPPVVAGHEDVIWSVAFSPDGKTLLTASYDNTARLWDVATGAPLKIFAGHTDGLETAIFSLDGKQALTASADGTARLWDIDSSQQRMQFAGMDGPVISAVFSPDGKSVLTGSADKMARLWDLQTGKVVRMFSGHTGAVVGAIFSPDGNSILTTSDDKTARLWDAASGKLLLTLTGHTANVKYAAFSPAGTLAATASDDGTVRLWDLDTGEEVRSLTGHSDVVYGVAFSPDGRTLLSGSWDGTARLWDVASGAEMRRFSGHQGPVNGVAFSPDGKFVATASADGTARLWYVDYHTAVQVLCSRLARDFTDEERVQYSIYDQKPTCPKR